MFSKIMTMVIMFSKIMIMVMFSKSRTDMFGANKVD